LIERGRTNIGVRVRDDDRQGYALEARKIINVVADKAYIAPG
jgi:hypothetical protein